MKLERKTLTTALSECCLKFSGESDGHSFEGYASTFNGVDTYGDTILPGAYEKVVKAIAKGEQRMPAMLFNHKMWDLPIGKFTKVKEDEKGLFMAGSFTKGLHMADQVAIATKAGTIDGMSVGIRLAMDDYEWIDDPKSKINRIIKSVTQMPEVSVVAFPADDAARIDLSSVKSEIDLLESIADFEAFLREAGGFSKSVTSALMHRMKVVLRSESATPSDTKAAENEVRALFDAFKLPSA